MTVPYLLPRYAAVSALGATIWRAKGATCARKGYDPKSEFVNDPAINLLITEGHRDELAKMAVEKGMAS
jgi:hypothetical protein